MASPSNYYVDPGSRRYIAAAMRAPLLEREQEADLARRWRDRQDKAALDELVQAYARYVVRIAAGFRGYGLPMGDLVQEGNIGLMEAAARFDPERDVRFSTYAAWWIRASIQDYILRNSSIVRIATTASQKTLFFNLRRLRAKLDETGDGTMTDADRRKIAEDLSVPVAAVERMEAHFSRPDRSLNATFSDGETDQFQDFVADDRPNPEENYTSVHDGDVRRRRLREALASLTEREQTIITQRFLQDDRKTLAEIGIEFGLTKERIRQIEARALSKLRVRMESNPERMTELLEA
ncbi:MAG: RNA polymerase factor sigma-32 [Alphaproteobacteria bacterium]